MCKLKPQCPTMANQQSSVIPVYLDTKCMYLLLVAGKHTIKRQISNIKTFPDNGVHLKSIYSELLHNKFFVVRIHGITVTDLFESNKALQSLCIGLS